MSMDIEATAPDAVPEELMDAEDSVSIAEALLSLIDVLPDCESFAVDGLMSGPLRITCLTVGAEPLVFVLADAVVDEVISSAEEV